MVRRGLFSHSPALFYKMRRFDPVTISPEEPDQESKDREELYEVRIIDNDVNTYQEVIEISMSALQISAERAYEVAWEVDHHGSCVVAVAPREEAETIADTIRVIGIEVRVSRSRDSSH